MKKIVIACVSILLFNLQLATFKSLHAQGFDWNRMSLSVDFSSQSDIFGIANGLRLTGHPERAVHLAAAYRLGRHWELGLYGGYLAAGAPTSSITGTGGNTLIRSIYVENANEIIYGAFVQWYLVPYDKRQYINMDVTLRAGFDLSGTEADNVWAGLSVLYRITSHVSLCLDVDFGSFRYTSTFSFINDRNSWNTRGTLRLQVSL